MAHIASCLASPGHPPDLPPPPPPPSQASKKPHLWRMLSVDSQPRYQLFPREKPAATTATADSRPRPAASRRRKVTVPDLGPMTTVHEVPMDSPTIPGLPPLHECGPDSADEDEAPIPPPKDAKPLSIPQRPAPAPFLRTLKSAGSLKVAAKPQSDEPSWTPCSDADRVITPSHSTPDLSLPRSAATDGTSSTTLTTPVSAALTEPQRVSPRPWDGQDHDSSRRHRRWISDSSGMKDRGRSRRRVETSEHGSKKAGRDAGRDQAPDRCVFEALPRGWRPHHAVGQIGVDDAASLQYQAHRQAERFEVLKKEDVEALSREIRKMDERTEHMRSTYAALRAQRRNMHSRIRQYLSSPRVGFNFESMLKQEERLADLDASIDDCVSELDRVENRRTRVRQKLLEHVAAANLLPVLATSGDAEAVRSPTLRHLSTPPRSPSSQAAVPPSGGNDDHDDHGSTAESASSTNAKLKRKPLLELEPVPEPESDAEPEQLDPEPAPRHSRVSSVRSPRRPGVESIRVYMGGDVFTLLADVEKDFSKLSDEEMKNTKSVPAADSPSSMYSPATWLATPRTPAYWSVVEEEAEEDEAEAEAEAGEDKPSERREQDDDDDDDEAVPSRLRTPTPTPPTPPLKDYPQPAGGGGTLLTSAVFRP
ncbi:hypothetical protein L249_5102 [Ophiocordyceps polyrhachis-furcata BCC 54312]|uniref:Up-regulated during septation protein 1 domain-containing protein n=1 Tax=Ophiocordyceps polyrhachis-furcata BCC 54312 TaxID=1330021 RepID=A0A367L3S1_9HYPO|nr:hypothetical protein L249_5102 [Ophiocordyceps polyrhachis-furcata BCC 54312]